MIRLVVAATALLIATPAAAADVASLNCIEQELDTQAAAAILERVGAGLVAGKTIPDVFDDSEFEAPLRACTKRHGWSDDAQSLASTYAKAHLLRSAVERGLTARGTDPAAVSTVYRSLPVNVRNALGMFDNEDARMKASEIAVQGLQRYKVPLHDARAIGRLMATLAILEFTSDIFAKA